MTQQDPEQPITAPEGTPDTSSPVRPRRGTLSLVSFLIVLGAWASLPLFYIVSATLGIISLVLGILAVRQRRGAWRNLAIVTVVASAVLVLVLVIFWAAIIYALSTM